LEQKNGVVVGENKKELIKNNQSFLFYFFPQEANVNLASFKI